MDVGEQEGNVIAEQVPSVSIHHCATAWLCEGQRVKDIHKHAHHLILHSQQWQHKENWFLLGGVIVYCQRDEQDRRVRESDDRSLEGLGFDL